MENLLKVLENFFENSYNILYPSWVNSPKKQISGPEKQIDSSWKKIDNPRKQLLYILEYLDTNCIYNKQDKNLNIIS